MESGEFRVFYQAQKVDAMIEGERSLPVGWFAGCSLAFGGVNDRLHFCHGQLQMHV